MRNRKVILILIILMAIVFTASMALVQANPTSNTATNKKPVTVMFTKPGQTNYAVPPGVTSVKVTVIGGGGGGGGTGGSFTATRNIFKAGGGGGGGGSGGIDTFTIDLNNQVTHTTRFDMVFYPSHNLTINVGVAGTIGKAGTNGKGATPATSGVNGGRGGESSVLYSTRQLKSVPLSSISDPDPQSGDSCSNLHPFNCVASITCDVPVTESVAGGTGGGCGGAADANTAGIPGACGACGTGGNNGQGAKGAIGGAGGAGFTVAGHANLGRGGNGGPSNGYVTTASLATNGAVILTYTQ
jgi:hypothetical protein